VAFSPYPTDLVLHIFSYYNIPSFPNIFALIFDVFVLSLIYFSVISTNI
jgi:hypothetical protein